MSSVIIDLKTGFAKDKSSDAKLMVDKNADLTFDPTNTSALKHPINERMYKKDKAMFGQPKCYNLVYKDDKFWMEPWHKPMKPEHQWLQEETRQIQGNKKYAFIILEYTDGLRLYLSSNKHYYAADQAKYVKAAGDIYFVDGKLLTFDNQSGAYCTGEGPGGAEVAKKNAIRTMEKIGLPVAKEADLFWECVPEATNPKLKGFVLSSGNSPSLSSRTINPSTTTVQENISDPLKKPSARSRMHRPVDAEEMHLPGAAYVPGQPPISQISRERKEAWDTSSAQRLVTDVPHSPAPNPERPESGSPAPLITPLVFSGNIGTLLSPSPASPAFQSDPVVPISGGKAVAVEAPTLPAPPPTNPIVPQTQRQQSDKEEVCCTGKCNIM